MCLPPVRPASYAQELCESDATSLPRLPSGNTTTATRTAVADLDVRGLTDAHENRVRRHS
eukprot:5697327-Prymnesium_polylepis.1